jgi:hypothetical protein
MVFRLCKKSHARGGRDADGREVRTPKTPRTRRIFDTFSLTDSDKVPFG